MDAAVREFCGAIQAGLGGEMDPIKLRAFVNVVGPLLGTQSKVHPWATTSTQNAFLPSLTASHRQETYFALPLLNLRRQRGGLIAVFSQGQSVKWRLQK